MQQRTSTHRTMISFPGFVRWMREAVTGSHVKEVSLARPRSQKAERRAEVRLIWKAIVGI
jgi:hypothetical protein